MKKFSKLMTKTIISIVDERVEKLVCMKRKKDSLKKVL
jgi:predicted CopG family antitoxin